MSLSRKIGNKIGWKTTRKIVVLESDDWGSVRTYSKDAYHRMLKAGLNVDGNQFTQFDALESNADLENLYDLLLSFKDGSGRPPVFTPMCVVANPDFELIKSNGLTKYVAQPLDETVKFYPEHNRVLDLWKSGITDRLFVPAIHAREHLNVKRYMKGLNDQENQGLRIAFDNLSIGASKYQELDIIEYLGAFHPETPEEIIDFEAITKEACDIFQRLCGYRPQHFIPPNKETAIELDRYLSNEGIKYITVSKWRKYPKGNEKYGYQVNWFGKKNKHQQLFLLRNAFFEPVSKQFSDWVNHCLADIQQAFQSNKPAVISTHRANYIGYIDQHNADYGLAELGKLLTAIINKWPEVEFMTSTELGDLMVASK